MKTVILKRNGQPIDMFEAMDIVKEIKTYTAENEFDEYGTNYYVMYFYFEIDGKHVYLVFAEPYFSGTIKLPTDKYTTIKIEERNLEVYIETDTPNAAFYNYSIKNEPMEGNIMLYHLFAKFLDLDDYLIIEEPNTVFISE